MAHVLKKRFPNATIAMLIRRYTSELVDDNRNVDQILFYDEGERPLPFFHLVATLRTENFDIVFHTYPRFRLALMTWFARIPIRVGTGYRWYSFLFNKRILEHRKDALKHELEYNLNLLSTVECPVDNEDITPSLEVKPQILDKVKNLLATYGIQKQDRIVILHPGSGGSARDWSSKNFGSLGQRLAQLPNMKVVVTGGKNEQKLVDDVCSIAGSSAIPLVNQLSLKEYAALVKLSALFIGNSTGPIHIAAAVGTPVVGLYPQVTALSAKRWGPYTSKKTIFTPQNKPPDCDECVKSKNGTCECMDSISVEIVYDAATNYLTNQQ
jgi:lipopolysaccharide heptosyltransferase II